jgi:hypothetical protein
MTDDCRTPLKFNYNEEMLKLSIQITNVHSLKHSLAVTPIERDNVA